MQVFNAYMKIIKKRLPSILILFVMFLAISLVLSNIFLNTGGPAAFSAAKSKIAFYNGDEGSPLADGLYRYLEKNAQIVDIPDKKEDIQDAFFYNQVSYVLRVPKGFTDSFVKGGGVQVEKTATPASANNVFMDFLVQKYLDMASFYIRNTPDASLQEIAANTQKDLEIASDVELKSYGAASSTKDLSFYFLFMAYSILYTLIMGVTSVMMAFNETDLSKRNLCAPIRPTQMNFQIVLGNIVFAVVVWALLQIAILSFYGKATLNTGTILYCVNALVFTMVALSIGFLAGKFVKNNGVQAAVTNVVALGISFISGVFVPQELLGGTVQTVSSFLPAYWYVKAVNDIRDAVDFNAQTLGPIVNSMLIQLGFAVAIAVIAMVVTKQRKASLA